MSTLPELPMPYGKYQLLERIAQGGMADVYLARSPGVEGFEKFLVIKRILPGLQKSPRFVRLFINEARISVCLNHPNIVQVYELGRVDDGWFIAMEHIHGRDLTRVVRALRAQGRRLPVALSVYVVASAVRGLAYAHGLLDEDGRSLGLVHGDISPHNLVVAFNGEVKIVDFGIARLAGTGFGDHEGRPGGGKFAYMSPEQVLGEPIDARSDVFSAGIVLYELLVDHRLYQHPDPEKKLRLVRDAVVPDPRAENPEIPEDLVAILQKAMARRPEDRFQDAAAFEEALWSFLFRERLRGDAGAMAGFMAELFGSERSLDPAASEVSRVARDLARSESQESPAPGPWPSEAPDPEPEPRLAHKAEEPLGVLVSEELRIVTVLDVEISGNTEPGRLADPGEIVESQREVQAWLKRRALRFGGLLTASPDESFAMLFGTSRTRVDDAERACACAIEMLETLKGALGSGPSVDLCIGIHQGEAAIGHVTGRGLPRVVGRGDTLKLARRLAGAAGPGQIMVSDRIALQVRDRFALASARPLSFRGRADEIRVHLLGGRVPDPLVDGGGWLRRGREIEELGEAMAGLAAGRGQVLLLTGEHGTGKSRLVRESLLLARARKLRAITVRVPPHGSDLPFPVLRDLALAVVRDLTGAEILSGRARQQGLQRMGLGSADASIMDVLLSHAPGRTRVLTRDLVLHALEALLRLLARSGPALAAVEDVHLLDLAERDLLPSLSRICSEEPLLVLLSSSESPPPELRRLSPGLIQLPRLTREAQEALVAERLGVRELDPRLTRLVYDATAGNPFYTMEYLKVLEQESLITLVDGRATLQDPLEGRETPQSLRILNAARIDGLEERARGMLKLAATLGRRFPVALLLDAAAEGPSQESEPERIRNLQSLLEGAFLRRCRDGAHLEFRDAALHEAAARCTLGSQRRRLHRRVAEAMLRVHARDLDAHFESLADHAAAGGLLGLAVETIHRAGELHREEGELEQALRCHEKGLAWLEDASPRSTVAPDPLDPAEEGSDGSGGSRPPELETGVLLRLRAGEAALRLGLVRKAEHHLQIALDEANDAGLVGEEGECCLALATLCRLGARRVEAQAYLDQALEAASASLPEAARLRILLGVGDVLLRWGRLDDAEAHFGEIVSEAGETAPGESSLVAGLRPRALLGLAEVAMRRDHVERAEALLIEALTEAGERQDPLLRLGLECAAARAALLAGRVTEALGRHRSALEGLQRTGARPEVARELLEAGRLVFAGGDDAHAAPLFEDLLALGRALGSAELEAWAEAFLALLLPVGDAPQGFACLERCLAFARRLEDPDMFSGSLWLRARWMAEHGEEDQCRGDFDAAQALARASGLDALARSISEDARRRVRPGDSRGPT